MSIACQWTALGTGLASHRLMQVSLGGALDGDAATQASDLIELAVAELAREGIPDDRIVRSRIWARDAMLRRIASDARIAVLARARRAASSSLIAPSRLPAGIDVIIDLVAMEGSGAKHV